jgi:recombination endonuclease VII
MLTKHCPLCERDLPIEQFNSKRKECKECSRWVKLLQRYGTTQEKYEEQLDAQGGVCAICGFPPEIVGVLVQDHDHSCCNSDRGCGKCNRGLICHSDNVSIGRMGDSPERLRRAADYIESYQTKERRFISE